MEIRCEKCGHLGPAAAVEPLDGGVGLICSACGHPNVIAMGAKAEAEEDGGVDGALEESPSEPPAQEKPEESFSIEVMERLLPEPGEGLRCPKCAALLSADDENCSKCGLNIEEGLRFKRGEEPWERPPPGREEVQEQAWLLWASVEERENPGQLEDFVEFVLAEGLVDFGIRRLQHYLVDHRDDPAARDGLARLSNRLEKTLQVARTQAEAGAETFMGELKRFRTLLLLGTLVFWVAILLLLSFTFWDRF